MAVLTSRTRHRVPPGGALAAIAFHLVAYGTLTFVWDSGIHFIHLYAILFVVEVGIMAVMARRVPGEIVPVSDAHAVDMTPWRHARTVSMALLAAMVAVYLLFSPIGVAGGGADGIAD